jgi:anti-anti-sigma factor
MTEVSITIENAPSSSPDKPTKIVHIKGQLDESNVDEKVKEIYKTIEETPKNLNMVFDMGELDYMNSKSIGYLTDLYGKLTESGGKVMIACAKPNILDILQVVGLTQLIPTFDTVKAALDGISGGGLGTQSQVPAQPATTQTPPTEEGSFKLQ